MATDHILSWITFFPLIGVGVILLAPKGRDNVVRWIAAIATAVPLGLSVELYLRFDREMVGFQFIEQAPWIKSFNIQYFMGIDGLSAPLIILTTLLTFICIFASWGIKKWVKAYFALFLLLETGMLGTFCSLDLILFYFFWEIMLLPMYFLIGVWGGPRREYAAIKFFLYTLVGSVLMLLGIIALYFASEPHTFNLVKLIEQNSLFVGVFWKVVFMGFFIGFAIKVPIFPFHTWLPDAHVEAPTAVSVILAGVLLKMGIYGILRIGYPVFVEAAIWFAPYLAILAVINIVYGSLCAMAQKDLKKLVAYSSIAHMGFAMLGMAAMTVAGLNGSVLQMFNHGIITAMLFLLVGVVYERAHHRDVDGFGGLAIVMPKYTAIVTLAFFASLGLPGLSGFISEMLCFLGAFDVYRTATIISISGVVLGAAYFLWAFQKIFLGPLNEKYADIPDINGRELFTLVPLGIIVIILGVYPMPVLDMMSTTMDALVKLMG